MNFGTVTVHSVFSSMEIRGFVLDFVVEPETKCIQKMKSLDGCVGVGVCRHACP